MTDVGNLVVKIAMDNSNFQQGVQNLNRSMRKVQSEFKNATAGLKDHGKGLDFLKAQQEKLSKTIELQSQKVDMHKKKFEESKKTLDDNVKAQTELKEKVDNAKKAYEESKATLGENAEETKKLKTEYEELSAEYDSNNEKIQNNVRTMENWEIKANNAEAQLKNLQSELDATNKEIEKQSSKWHKLSERLEETGTKMQGIGIKMSDIGKGLTTKLTLPIVGIGTKVSKIGMEFEASMSNVKALSGATGEDFKSLEVKAREMGSQTSKSAKDAADGMGFLALAGWDTQQIIGGIEPVLRLAEAGNMDLAQSANLTADSMSAMGLSVEELPHYLDLVAQTARSSNTDIDEMMQAYIAVGGTLRGLNVPMEESAVILGLLANKGIKGAEAGTALNAVMMNLTAPTGRAAKALDKLNLSAFDGNGEFKGLTNVLMEVKEKTKGMTEEQKNQILAMIGGKEHVKDLNALLNGLEEDYGTLSTAIDGADGALMDMSKTMQDNNKGSLTELKSAIEELALKIYDVLRPKIASIIGTLQKWTDKLNSLTPAQQETIIKIAEMLAVIGPLLFAGGKLIGGIGTMLVKFSILSESIAKIGGATKLLGVGLKALPIVGVVAGVAALGIGFKKLKDKMSEASIETDIFKDAVGENVSAATEEAVGSFLKLNDEATVALNELNWSGQNVTKEMAENITGTFEEMGNQVKQGIEEKFGETQKVMQDFLATSENFSKEEQANILNNIQQGKEEQIWAVEESEKTITEIMNTAKEERRGLKDEEIQQINELQNKMVEDGIEALSKYEIESQGIIARMKQQHAEISAEQAAEVVKNSKKRKDEAIKAADEESQTVIEEAIRQYEVMGTISEEECNKIIDEALRKEEETVASAERAHLKVVSEAQDQAEEHINEVDWETGEIKSKWEVMKDDVIDRATELKESLSETWEGLKESTSEKWNNMKDSISEKWSGIKENTVEAVNGIVESTSEKWNSLKESTSETWDNIKQSTSDAWNSIKETISDLISNITEDILDKFQVQIQGVKDIMTGLKDIIKGIWETIKTIILGVAIVILDIVTLNFSQLKTDVSNLNERLGESLKTIWNGIKTVISGIVKIIWQTVKQIWTGIKNTVINLSRAIWNGVKSIWNGIKQSIINLAKGAWQGVKNAFNNMKQSAINITRNIKTSIVSIWNGILSWFRTLPSKLKTIAVNMFNAMKDGIVNTMNNVTTAAKDVGTGIKDAFKELPGKLLEIGKNLMTSLAKGIRDKILAPVEAAKEAAEKTAEKFREKLGIASPSKVFRGFGHNIDEGLALGIQDKAILVEKAAKDLANKTIKSIDINLDIKSKSNINTDVVKKKAAEIVKIGEDAEFKFKKTIQNMNADDLEETKWWLDNEYRYQEKIVNRKLELLLKANRAEDKEQIENLRKRRDNLKSNFDYAMKIVDEHNKKMNESAEKNSTKFNETMYKIDESIKILSDDTDDLTQNLTNQKAIIILQERKVAELEKQYNKLCSTLGTSADITKKTKEELEKSREELEKYGNTVVETEKKIKQSQIDSINDLTSRLKKALKERYDEELKTQEKAIKDEIDNLDTWKKESIERIDNVYDLKVKRIEEAAEVQIKALQNEIDALDEAEKKKTREEEDAERVRKIQRLKEALKYEHDEFNKVEIQKELNKEIADREEQLRKWQVEDRKESLNNQIKDVKDNADKQKDALKQQQEFEKDRINYIYEYEKTALENRLEKVKEFYDEKTHDAALQAEAEKMIFDNQQEEIIKLLHSYEEDYKQAGQSLGEKLVEGFEPKIQEIMNMIDSIQTSFESARNNVIQGMSKMSAMREAGNTSISNETVNNSNSKIVNNNVNINSPKALNHREVNRQTENTLRRLALT